jgi:serine/threonine protein kinase
MSDHLMLGRKIKGYQLAEVLGRGGMGCVYRAQHPLIGKQVAIKVLQGVQSPSMVSRFVLEAKTVNDIRHENLIDILDFDELEEGNPYIIMEYLEGRSLNEAIEDGPFSLAQVGHIGLQLCSALHAAHQKGVVHRDLKGDNIFLIHRANQQNFVKVLDFGIAKLLDSADDNKHRTEANSILGTPLYMAPEQITGQPIDARTDIYALGVLLYQMVTGHPPFNDQSSMVLLAMHVAAPPPLPSQFIPDLSETLEWLILRCLKKNPAERYASMAKLATALGEACGIDPTLYMSNSLLPRRLFTAELPVVSTPPPVDYVDSPTEHVLPVDLKETMSSFAAIDEDSLLPATPAESTTPPEEPPLEGSISTEPPLEGPISTEPPLEGPTPSAAPEGGWESIYQLIASIDAKKELKLQEAKPTTEMTREEIRLITGGHLPVVKIQSKPAIQPLSPFFILLALLFMAGGFAVGWFFLY